MQQQRELRQKVHINEERCHFPRTKTCADCKILLYLTSRLLYESQEDGILLELAASLRLCTNLDFVSPTISPELEEAPHTRLPLLRHELSYAESLPAKGEIPLRITKLKRNLCSFREDRLEPITLATHSTSQFVKELSDQLDTWDGPISLALFIDQGSAAVVQYLVDLHKCEAKYTDKLFLHVVYRLSAFQQHCQSLPVEPQSMPCKAFTDNHKRRFLDTIVPPFGIYPINVMRNVARRGAPSPIHLISDIEMLFSYKFAERAKKLANEHIKKNGKKLIVIRRFEINDRATVPRNHTALKKLINSRQAFEYHHKFFPIGHTIEALWEWFRRSNAKSEPYVWEIPYKNPAWEPQFIMHTTDPYSEEDIPTRLRDQQALVYELCRANYTFLLVSQLFNVHRGVKTTGTDMDSAVIAHQSRLRSKAYRHFVYRMNRMYPDTMKRCRIFKM